MSNFFRSASRGQSAPYVRVRPPFETCAQRHGQLDQSVGLLIERPGSSRTFSQLVIRCAQLGITGADRQEWLG